MAENEKVEQNTQPASSKADKAKKDKKSEKKPGVFARIGRWFHELKVELKKVVWPTRKQTLNNTLIVIACVIFVGIFIWLFDAVAGALDPGPDPPGGGLKETDMADNANWYVVHTYSGYENTVKATIEKYVENRHLLDVIHEISIPLETVTEITDNGPKEVERKVFPGYVLVKMVMNDETWHVIRNIRGVTGFLGEGNNAIPLSEEDVAALGVEKREIVVGYQAGDSVKITDGALESFLGTVEEVDLDRGKVRVVVSMFGRETPVELELDQVEPIGR